VDTSLSGHLRLTYPYNQLRSPRKSVKRIWVNLFFFHFLGMKTTAQMRLTGNIKAFVWQNSLPENQKQVSPD